MKENKKFYRNRLYLLRKRFMLSQEEICYKLNITKRTLYNYEHCIKPIPSDKLIGFAEIYRCTTDYILCFENLSEAIPDTVDYSTTE